MWILDQDNGIATNANGITGTNAGQRRAQSFTAVKTADLSCISLILADSGNPTDNLQVDIFSDSAGSPNVSLEKSADVAAGPVLTATTQVFHFKFSGTLLLTAGTRYWIVVSRSGSLDDTNYFLLGGSTATAVSGETLKLYNGTTWGASAQLSFWNIIRVSDTMPLNNVQAVKVGGGMSTGERIR